MAAVIERPATVDSSSALPAWDLGPGAAYTLAIIAPGVATAGTAVLWHWMQPPVGLLFFPAVVISALCGGMGPGLVATVASVMSAAFFFMPPYFSLAVGLQDGARLIVFTLAAVVTASLSSARRTAEGKQRRAIVALHEALDELTQLSQDLERRVEARTTDLDASNQALKAEIIKSRDLSRRLVQARETERRRLARELHDQIGQSLTGLKFTLEATSRDSAPAKGKPEALELVESLMAQVREISLDLRPAVLDDLGLIPALLWHFDRYHSQTGIRVMFTQTGIEERLTPEIETAAFRIVQEALTNIARHAGVTEARVWIRKDPEELSVIVEDEGCGFPQPSSQALRSPGLSGMRERATLVGGHFSLVTAPSSGTRISAVLPLQHVVRHQG
jgi:signal transduction histidine kinase